MTTISTGYIKRADLIWYKAKFKLLIEVDYCPFYSTINLKSLKFKKGDSKRMFGVLKTLFDVFNVFSLESLLDTKVMLEIDRDHNITDIGNPKNGMWANL